MRFGLVAGEITDGGSRGLARMMAVIALIAIGIVVGGFCVWITSVRQSGGSLQGIELSLGQPAACTAVNHYTIFVQQSAPLRIIGTFSDGTRLDVSADPDLTYHLSPCEELGLDEINNCVTGLLISEREIPLYVKINNIKSNTIYIKVVLPTC